jgi:cbb3-type cytochrome oxidase subunit 3
MLPLVPLASSSGIAVISGAAVGAGLLLWWLLRAEARDEAQEAAANPEPQDAAEANQNGRAQTDPSGTISAP